MLNCDVTSQRGLVRVSGVVPNGQLTVQRQTSTLGWATLRGGSNMNIAIQGFSLEDSEAPLGVPLTYRAVSVPTDRLIQRNLVNSPDFSLGVQSWTAGASRTLSLTGGKGHVTNNPSGSGITGRTIAEVGVSQLLPSTSYLITGTVKFTTPDVWTWQDVKDFGTWAAVKAAKANWEAVRSSVAGTGPVDAFNTFSVALSNGGTDYVAPVQAFTIPMASANQWTTFAVYVTTPSVIPSTARLRLLHGSSVREFSTSWDLDQFAITSAEDAAKVYRLFWFNGNTPVPDRPQDYLMQNEDWEDLTGNATITWEGTAGNSASRFTAPSSIYTTGTCQIDPPSFLTVCEPVLLSDPVSSGLAQWFGLAEIGSLTRAARSTIFDVLGRDFYINSSSVRGTAMGTLTLYTNTLAERTQANMVFSSGRVLMLRNPNPAYPENNWYIACKDVEESRTLPDARRPERTWTVPFVTVERPTGLIEASSGVLWQQLKDSGQSWLAVKETRDNWLEVITEAL